MLLNQKETENGSELIKNKIRSLYLASEKGALRWLNAMPLKRYQFDLTKREFRNGIALRYGWDPVEMPALCAGIEDFTVAHALRYPKGGYKHMRQNELRDSIFVNVDFFLPLSSVFVDEF